QFCATIIQGRTPEVGEALRWLQHTNPYRNPEHEQRLLNGIRAAGLERGRGIPLPLAPAPDLHAFRRVGSLWHVSLQAQDAWLPHLKGFVDLATLLAEPGRQVHCSELMGGVISL